MGKRAEKINGVTKAVPILPKISISLFLYWVIWPFGALISNFKKFREPYVKTLFLLFCVYYGFVFIYADPFTGKPDSARYALRFIEMHGNSISLEGLAAMFYNPQSKIVDIYEPFILWLVSRFTGDPRFLFAVFALVFGFFWVQNLWLIFRRINGRIEFLLLLFIVGFILINPVWNINGVRMWTAAQIFLYGSLIYLLEDSRKKGLIFILSSVLVHFSFMFPAALFIAFIFLPMNLWLFFVFFISASFVNELNIRTVRETLSFLPEVFQPKIESYTSEQYVQKVMGAQSPVSWHVKFADIAGRIIIYVWVLIVFLNRKKWLGNNDMLKLFCFGLFLGGFAKIAGLIPSGGRFWTIAASVLYAVIVLFISGYKPFKYMGLLRVITIPLLSFVVLFNLRLGLNYTGVLTFAGNPLISFFLNDRAPLIDLIKQIF